MVRPTNQNKSVMKVLEGGTEILIENQFLPLDDKVLMQVEVFIRMSQTLMKAEDTVKAILVASEYLTHTTLLG